VTWTKIDDGFDRHPKIVTVGPIGELLQLHGLIYCNHYLTDGFIPSGAVGQLLDQEWLEASLNNSAYGYPSVRKFAAVLVAADVWEEVEGGYQIVHFDEFQPSKAEVIARTDARTDAKRAAGLASAASRRSKFGTAQPGNGSRTDQDQFRTDARTASRTDARTESRTESRTASEQPPNPVPVPVPTTTAKASVVAAKAPQLEILDLVDPTVGDLVALFVDASRAAGSEPTSREKARIGKEAKRLLGEGKDPQNLARAIVDCARRNRLDLLEQVVGDVERDAAGTPRGPVLPPKANSLAVRRAAAFRRRT